MCASCQWEEAIGSADEILTDAENIPDAGEVFANSVIENVSGIRATISEHEHATVGQWTALDNMRDGVDRWLD